jgi:hypothetical protein
VPQDCDSQPSAEATEKGGQGISRRDFGRYAAVAAALTFSTPASESLQPQNASASKPGQIQEVEAKLANIIRKYGDRLSDSQHGHLRRILNYNEQMLASIRAFPLQNGDAPANVLKIVSLEAKAR